MRNFVGTLLCLALVVAPGLAAAQTPAEQIGAWMEEVNAQLAAEGANYAVAVAETFTAADSDEMGITVLAKSVGNKHLGHDFVPGDTRRTWSGPGALSLTHAIDTTGDADPLGVPDAAAADAAIERATATWDELTCAELGLDRANDFGIDIGLVAFLNGLGGSPFVFADVQHGGFRDINFGGGTIAATFTFVFNDGAGNLTDIDGNGRLDTAFREIEYDANRTWADDGVGNIDIETVAVHELGHGFSQGHFGQVAISNAGNLTASPRAVMNAIYGGPFPNLQGSDEGGHCSDWSAWPLQ